MKTIQAEQISTGHGLLEGPLWTPEGLLAADAIAGGVLRFTDSGSTETVIEHRRGIGGMALHASGGLVISGRNVAVKGLVSSDDTATHVLRENDPSNGVVGYNDLTVDTHGRLYVGSLAFVASESRDVDKPGQLFCIDLDGSARIVAEDVLLTNGLGFSPDGSLLYHADTLRSTVNVYDVDDRGGLGPKRSFVTAGDGEQPDGLAVDAAGNVWVALPHSGQVGCFNQDGERVASIQIDVPMVTSLTFGGDDLRDVYIVSGSEGLDTDRGAGVFKARVETPGLPAALCRVEF
ncbi:MULTISPECIES: SMP-30/gluconolactonase/LRE family protein [Rhodococcus]|jgi:gluconolactonase|uniref:SMP-30/gluconolactonase/LRE family protein n=1 Tax=Rhodococcus TaxID=1827 RepID=UPI0010D2B9BB|nr:MULTISPECIES: SMP-30/gluconolactonase/LRE family protein [Rhodococcus]MDI9977408.1 SMP-30/gluconolactonase/LRE family protein [Rhodococcus sp. IEGM 1307]NDV04977.1 SMP-30/gluconolactonase/LRE family protein [Rhodococcus sp. IEGM 248]QSE86707.1 SMP-30/gluconolactonase/LRE family protein [Rhodococcus koreensis]WKN60619.1 SMP-30/gluconolactonase/LRE family protein [Rhodococcus opacus]